MRLLTPAHLVMAVTAPHRRLAADPMLAPHVDGRR